MVAVGCFRAGSVSFPGRADEPRLLQSQVLFNQDSLTPLSVRQKNLHYAFFAYCLAAYFPENLSDCPHGRKNPADRSHFIILWYNHPGDKTIFSIAALRLGWLVWDANPDNWREREPGRAHSRCA
jgi:hypothetical protein